MYVLCVIIILEFTDSRVGIFGAHSLKGKTRRKYRNSTLDLERDSLQVLATKGFAEFRDFNPQPHAGNC